MKRSRLVILFLIVILAVWIIAAPPRFWLNLTKRADLSDPVATGQNLVVKYDCRSCHQIEGQGRPFGPGLDGVANKLDPQTLANLLSDPRSVNKYASMPDLHLSDSEITAIIAYFNAIN
jgi:mono/diheme cytochrome c family protein